MQRWMASYGHRPPGVGIGMVTDDASEDFPPQHPQRFREFLAAELAALEEKLVARFELGEPSAQMMASRCDSDPKQRVVSISSYPRRRSSDGDEEDVLRAWRRDSDPKRAAGSMHSAATRRRSSSDNSEGAFRASTRRDSDSKRVSMQTTSSAARRRSSSGDDEVLCTRPTWERMVIRLLASEDPAGFGIADMVERLTSWRSSEQDTVQALMAEESVPEELITPHPMWMSQNTWTRTRDQNSLMRSSRSSNSKNIFALSRVGEGGASTMRDCCLAENRPKTGGMSNCIVIHPDSMFRYIWTLVGAAFLMHDLFTIPMEAVKLWSGGSSTRLMEVAICYWSADLLVQGLMGYRTQNHIEMRPLKTLRHYATTWMLLDAIVILIDIMFYVFRFSSTVRTFRFLKLLRLVRLARLHKLVRALKSIMKSNTSELADLLVKIGRLMFMVLCHCHLTACAWYGIAEVYEGAERPPGSKPNWVEESGLSDQSNFFCYVVSLHWSITQFTPATNDVVPVNAAERTFAIAVVLIGFVAFSVFLSSMIGTLSQLKSLKQSQVRERQQLLQFFRNKRVPAELAGRVLQLFDAEGKLARTSLVEEDIPALSVLPLSIRLRIRREYGVPLLQTSIILGGVYRLDRRCFLQIIFDGMVDERYNAQQEVFVDGIDSHCMYAVSLGDLKYYQRGVVTELELGEWVSEASLYVQWVHQGSLVAKTCSNVMRLDCKAVRQIVLHTGGELFRTLRCCAVLFAHKLETSTEGACSCLSDLGDASRDKEVLWRALNFCKVSQSQRRPSERSAEEMTMTPMTTAASRGSGIRSTLTSVFSKELPVDWEDDVDWRT